MPIVNFNTAPVRPVPTKEDYIKRIVTSNTEAFKALRASVVSGFNQVWNNSDYTPLEILQEFGTDAKALFELSWGAQQILKQLDPSWQYLIPTYTAVFNDDGSIKELAEREVTPTE